MWFNLQKKVELLQQIQVCRNVARVSILFCSNSLQHQFQFRENCVGNFQYLVRCNRGNSYSEKYRFYLSAVKYRRMRVLVHNLRAYRRHERFFSTTHHFSSHPLCNEQTKFRDREDMKTVVSDPWINSENSCPRLDSEGNHFEDCFVENRTEETKLPDSEQYLQSLYSKLRAVQGGSSKKDLVKSLTAVKEDCIARILTEGCQAQTEEESELAANPLVRHIAPHLQALTASELVQLLKADVLQAVTDQQNDQPTSE